MILEHKHPAPKHEYAQLIITPGSILDLHNFFLVVQSILTVSSEVNINWQESLRRGSGHTDQGLCYPWKTCPC